MKCPKCGYNSFETHNACKKCANDLTGYKDTHGLKAIVLSRETRTSMAEELMAEMPKAEPVAAEVPDDMFSFDISGNETPSADAQDDPFSFDDALAPPVPAVSDYSFVEGQVPPPAAEADFSDLLQSTPQPGTGSGETAAPDGFSWDDVSAPGTGQAAPVDDFDSLFGEPDETDRK